MENIKQDFEKNNIEIEKEKERESMRGFLETLKLAKEFKEDGKIEHKDTDHDYDEPIETIYLFTIGGTKYFINLDLPEYLSSEKLELENDPERINIRQAPEEIQNVLDLVFYSRFTDEQLILEKTDVLKLYPNLRDVYKTHQYGFYTLAQANFEKFKEGVYEIKAYKIEDDKVYDSKSWEEYYEKVRQNKIKTIADETGRIYEYTRLQEGELSLYGKSVPPPEPIAFYEIKDIKEGEKTQELLFIKIPFNTDYISGNFIFSGPCKINFGGYITPGKFEYSNMEINKFQFEDKDHLGDLEIIQKRNKRVIIKK